MPSLIGASGAAWALFLFDLRLKQPALIASSWHDPAIERSDGWRTEIFDAARFDPALCKPGTTWILGDASSIARYPWLAQAVEVARTPRLTVWRWNPADLAGDANARVCGPRAHALR